MNHVIKTFFSVLAVVMLLASLAPAVNALSLNDENDSAKRIYNDAKKAYTNAVSTYKSAREDYLTAKLKYQERKNATNLDVAVDKGKSFLLNADKAALEYVELLQAKVQEMKGIDDATRTTITGELQTQIDWLINEQAVIQGAAGREALVAEAKTVSDYWDGIRVSTKKYTGQILAGRVNYVLDSLEALNDDVQAKIAIVKEDGQDVTELEALYVDFKADVATANTEYGKAVASFQKITNLTEADTLFTQGREFLRKAEVATREAHANLVKIVKALDDIKLDNVSISGTGRLYASGDGEAGLDGNGSIDGKVSNSNTGTLTVIDRGGDVTIDTKGAGNRSENTNAQGEKVITITGIGNAKISGTNVVVTVKGDSIDIIAEGTGNVTLTGKGTYKTSKNGKEYNFTAKPVTISLQSSNS